jgi:hypothetical protein
MSIPVRVVVVKSDTANGSMTNPTILGSGMITTTTASKVFKFRVQWRATALTYKIEAKDFAQAEKRLHRLLKRTDGGEHAIEIIYIE